MVTGGRCLVEADFALRFYCKQKNLRSLRRFSSPQKVLRLFGDPIWGIVFPWRRLFFFRQLRRHFQPIEKRTRAAADNAVSFIEQLRHTKGEFYNQPFELIDWQERIIRDIFGTIRADGYRQFNTAYIEISKKSGKSELAAVLVCDRSKYITGQSFVIDGGLSV